MSNYALQIDFYNDMDFTYSNAFNITCAYIDLQFIKVIRNNFNKKSGILLGIIFYFCAKCGVEQW